MSPRLWGASSGSPPVPDSDTSPKHAEPDLMDSWEWNKIAGAVLGTLMFVLVLKIAIGAIFEVPPPAKPGYVVAGVPAENTSAGTSAPAVEALPDWGTVLPKASAPDGQKVAARCQ